jgi:hypothetical protein
MRGKCTATLSALSSSHHLDPVESGSLIGLSPWQFDWAPPGPNCAAAVEIGLLTSAQSLVIHRHQNTLTVEIGTSWAVSAAFIRASPSPLAMCEAAVEIGLRGRIAALVQSPPPGPSKPASRRVGDVVAGLLPSPRQVMEDGRQTIPIDWRFPRHISSGHQEEWKYKASY